MPAMSCSRTAGRRHRRGAELGLGHPFGSNIENLVLTGPNAINGTGNNLDNNLGNGAANILDGSFGADTMTGGLGNDTYVIDNAGDVAIESPARAPTPSRPR